MTKANWKKKITKACEEAGTYKPFFESVIDTLAGIMELNDNAQKEFKESGGSTTIEHTNKGGATNTVKNPALVVIMDCNAQALQYWAALGLTAKSYKSMMGSLEPADKDSSFEDMLGSLGI